MTSKGIFSRSTRKLAKHHKPSRLTITEKIKSFRPGDKVVVLQKGNFRDIPHPRYRGRVGDVVERRGSAYVVKIEVSKSITRKLIVPQRHLEGVR